MNIISSFLPFASSTQSTLPSPGLLRLGSILFLLSLLGESRSPSPMSERVGVFVIFLSPFDNLFLFFSHPFRSPIERVTLFSPCVQRQFRLSFYLMFPPPLFSSGVSKEFFSPTLPFVDQPDKISDAFFFLFHSRRFPGRTPFIRYRR